jgi:hypothetical protein
VKSLKAFSQASRPVCDVMPKSDPRIVLKIVVIVSGYNKILDEKTDVLIVSNVALM